MGSANVFITWTSVKLFQPLTWRLHLSHWAIHLVSTDFRLWTLHRNLYPISLWYRFRSDWKLCAFSMVVWLASEDTLFHCRVRLGCLVFMIISSIISLSHRNWVNCRETSQHNLSSDKKTIPCCRDYRSNDMFYSLSFTPPPFRVCRKLCIFYSEVSLLSYFSLV